MKLRMGWVPPSNPKLRAGWGYPRKTGAYPSYPWRRGGVCTHYVSGLALTLAFRHRPA
jgi:hypothetical protein